jgi:hypothetical protein
MRTENLADLVNIAASLKNKYSMVPFAVHAQLRLSGCLMDTMLLNKLMNLLLDSPRQANVLVVPHGFPKATQFEVNFTLGEGS